MMGRQSRQMAMIFVDIESLIPETHLLREIEQAIKNQQIIEIEYERMKEPRLVRRRVQPVGIMFSEYYFYLTAFLEDKTDFENPDDAKLSRFGNFFGIQKRVRFR